MLNHGVNLMSIFPLPSSTGRHPPMPVLSTLACASTRGAVVEVCYEGTFLRGAVWVESEPRYNLATNGLSYSSAPATNVVRPRPSSKKFMLMWPAADTSVVRRENHVARLSVIPRVRIQPTRLCRLLLSCAMTTGPRTPGTAQRKR